MKPRGQCIDLGLGQHLPGLDLERCEGVRVGLGLAGHGELDQPLVVPGGLRELGEDRVDPCVAFRCQRRDGAGEVFAVMVGRAHAQRPAARFTAETASSGVSRSVFTTRSYWVGDSLFVP